VRRLLVYLATIASFYLLVGVALVLAVDAALHSFGDIANQPAVLWAQLVIGVALFVLCWRYDSGRRRRRGEPDRATRWRARVLHEQASTGGLARLALTAGALELLTMLPYLAAVGLLASAAFLSRHADTAIGWVMGIAGFFIARDAAVRLWWPELLAGS
jgi:Sap, sulfolipid-1-addressing protein